MKIQKLFLATTLLLSVFAISAKGPSETMKPKAKETIQCGVSSAAIIEYLKTCSHHHTSACCVVDIPGGCNSTATIENCGTATVFVSNGIIVGHSDSNGICGG